MADPVIIRYTGGGVHHHPGIPARDLSLEEFDALPEEHRATVRASRAYDYAGAVAAAKASKPVKAAAKESAGA